MEDHLPPAVLNPLRRLEIVYRSSTLLHRRRLAVPLQIPLRRKRAPRCHNGPSFEKMSPLKINGHL